MKTVRRLFYADILSSVAFVSLAFLSLFFFIDFVDAISDSARRGNSALVAAATSLLEVPSHFYELAPISVLIGTIYALSRLAQSSEFTILRTGGLGPGRALRLLATLGLAFGLLTFFVGDYLAPFSENRAVQLKALTRGGLGLGRTGTWLKDRQTTPEGERSYSVNVARTGTHGEMLGIKIFEFDSDDRLIQQISADSGIVEGQTTWTLSNVTLTHWIAGVETRPPQVTSETLPRWQWNGGLSADVVASALLPLATMSTLELWRYIGHLDSNEQAAQAYEIQFWKRALYPFACLVMVGLALPFAYLHARAGGISLKVFGGIMLGITFMLLNNLAGHLGLLRNWTPWIVAAAPSALFLLMSMAAFAWLVRYR
ncbi:MAG: LPS export ABC transporter permease LptG [Pseudomonadota bacterium]|nr:LPS export ABC transporter permease LptG [Pseudomonadota bacterium]